MGKPTLSIYSILLVIPLLGIPITTAAQASPDPQPYWLALTKPTFDAEGVAIIENGLLQRDVATLTLDGLLALGAISLPGTEKAPIANKGIFAASFKGSGRLHLAPTLPLERQQLAFHSGRQVLEAEFDEAVFVFTDNTYQELAPQLTFQPSEPGMLDTLYNDRQARWTRYGINWEPRVLKGLLAEDPQPHAFLVAEVKTREYDWLTLIVDAADPEEIELHQIDSREEAVTIWSKFPARGRHPQEVFEDPLAQREYRLERYTLDITVEKNTELYGQAEVRFVMRRAGERVLLLALDPTLRVTEVTTADGQPLAFFQPDDPKDHFFLGDYLAVVGGEPFPLGENTLRLRYAGNRIVRRVGSGSFFCQSFGWYPTYGDGRGSLSLSVNVSAARYDFDLTLRVPKKYQAVATGYKVDEHEGSDYRVTRWQSELPLAVAGFAFGDYKVLTDTVSGTHLQVYANKRGPAQITSPAQYAKDMAGELANTFQVAEAFFGPYPYKKLAVSNIPYHYGQGWPSLLYISAGAFRYSPLSRFADAFRAHETSHQWWGHIVGWKSYHDQWLSEGFAEFSGILYTMFRRKLKDYFWLLRESRKTLLTKDEEKTVYDEIGPIYAGVRLRSAKHPSGYDVVVYQKGAWVLHMIRMMLYDPQDPQNPDARFMAMMQDFTGRFHNQAASTEDFKAIVEKHMLPHMDLDGNGTMDWFFDSWVYGTGIPKYEFEYNLEPAPHQPGQFTLRGELRQSNVPEDFHMIIPLFFHQGKRSIRAGWLRARGPVTTFQATLGFKPNKVTLNDGEDVLCTVSYK